jgi:hypothetical protein
MMPTTIISSMSVNPPSPSAPRERANHGRPSFAGGKRTLFPVDTPERAAGTGNVPHRGPSRGKLFRPRRWKEGAGNIKRFVSKCKGRSAVLGKKRGKGKNGSTARACSGHPCHKGLQTVPSLWTGAEPSFFVDAPFF